MNGFEVKFAILKNAMLEAYRYSEQLIMGRMGRTANELGNQWKYN